MTDDLDYIKAEAERLPNGTAAKFLAALDAMDGATEPLEGDGKLERRGDTMTDQWTPIQQLTDEVLDADHPSDLHVVGVTYDPTGRVATVNGERVYRGEWIVREQDGSLSHRRYGTQAEQDAFDAAVNEIEECEGDQNWDPVRLYYPITAASEARLQNEVERLRAALADVSFRCHRCGLDFAADGIDATNRCHQCHNDVHLGQPTFQWNSILDDIGNTTITQGGES